jgi:hypothetical protein
VGRGLLVNVLPRASVVPDTAESLVLLGPPIPDQQTFLYLPSEQGEPGVSYGPAYVGDGMVMAGFTVRPAPPEAPDS